ncbi:hypothetical protein GCM10022245_63830 [Streptomyces mayteni]
MSSTRGSRSARANLRRAGYAPAVHRADGALGCAPGAPYDRVIATCAVRSLPPAWLDQLRLGGTVVAPWSSAWCGFGTLTATRHHDGTATGRFAAYGSYMELRAEPSAEPIEDDPPPAPTGTGSETDVSPWAVAGEDYAAQFVIGQAVPGVWHRWDTETGTEEAPIRLHLADEAATSGAAVDYDGRQLESFRVTQRGPRRLWDEVASAWRWWHAQGRPAVDRFGLTVAPDGGHTVWLDSPGTPIPRRSG